MQYITESPTERRWRLQELIVKVYKISLKAMSFFHDEGDVKHGFEQREGQQEMALEILDAIKDKQHIAIEAGVGIGKSFAYLVPLMFYNQETKKPVIIATSTIALQEQLLGDVKRLQGLLNMDQDIVLVKGQTHYICRKRAEIYLADRKAALRDQIIKGIRNGCQERKSFPFEIPNRTWDKIGINRFGKETCLDCTYPCDYKKTRDALKRTKGIILCNQNFLIAHLDAVGRFSEGMMNRNAEIVVIDEAHNLEEKVRNATTERLTKQDMIRKLSAAYKSVAKDDQWYVEKDINFAIDRIREFFLMVEEQVQKQIANSRQDMQYAERFFFQMDDIVWRRLDEMVDRLDIATDQIQILETHNRRGSRSDTAVEELIAINDLIYELRENLDEYLIWLEKQGNNIALVFCPKDTQKIIRRLFFFGRIQTVMTSATLTQSGSERLTDRYAYFIKNTGFPIGKKGVLSEPKDSPYPYDEHAMLYYCGDLPHPTKEHDAFIREGTKRLVEILKISQGKALILFTAKSDMEQVYQTLKGMKLPYRIMMQQKGSSQDAVLKEFRENVNSVLLGTGAYWEGISIEGKALSNLIIFRLPFPVPDPIIDYKCSIAKDPLMDVQVPEMITKLKQGIGRLIRNYTDTGIVSIIDPRLGSERPVRYRDVVWESIPIHNKTTSLVELSDFYQKLEQAK